VANPSIWPFVAAIGVVVIFGAEILKFRIMALVGALVVVAAVIMWNWPEPADATEEEEREFEERHGIPVHLGGSWVVARWGMGLIILFMAIATSALLLSYFYLRIANPDWPPAGIPMPEVSTMLASSALIVVAGLAFYWGLQRIRRGDNAALQLSLVAGLLLGAAGLTLKVIEFAGLGFDSQTHAYGSIYHTISGFLFTVVGAALIMGAMTLYWSFQGHFTERRHVVVLNLARFWISAMVVWVAGFAVIDLAPFFL
jgi:cytochrome c oxidase subunit I+III